MNPLLYDVFICHASEDKETFVRPLADELHRRHVEVWYDEFSLKVGDSIRRAIDHGLRSCRYGVVVLSKAFFQKNWPQYELDGLVEREITGGASLVLPIWHGVDHAEVLVYSPALAGKKAVSSWMSLDEIVSELIKVVKPSGSPLLVARDELLAWGVYPPVVTDPYWLKVVEASNRLLSFGAAVPEEATWGRWCFPLPPREDDAATWGNRLAWTAMQMKWIEAAEDRKISPLTPPVEVLAFLREFPGLLDTCLEFPGLTADWAPQLTMRGFEGEFEAPFEEAYQASCEECARQSQLSPTWGTGITNDGRSPVCDERWALRRQDFGRRKPSNIANHYFGGDMFGPSPSPYKHADHLFWLLSDQSRWLPTQVHAFLLQGQARWGVWLWGEDPSLLEKGHSWPTSGRLSEALYKARDEGKQLRWTSPMRDDLVRRADEARKTLDLPEKPAELVDKFHRHRIAAEYLDEWAKKRQRQRRARP